jgi:hypothetical protein
MSVMGDPAIGRERQPDVPSALTLVHDRIVIQFVSSTHSLSELVDLAEQMTYE